MDAKSNDWAPEKIWLQREQGEGGSHTWCEDSVGDGDLIEEAAYVRADVARLPHSDAAQAPIGWIGPMGMQTLQTHGEALVFSKKSEYAENALYVAPGAAAQGEVVRVPEGYALMPLKPTAEIVKAGGEARIADFKLNGTTLSVKDANRVSEAMYRAMINAALTAPSTGDLEVES